MAQLSQTFNQPDEATRHSDLGHCRSQKEGCDDRQRDKGDDQRDEEICQDRPIRKLSQKSNQLPERRTDDEHRARLRFSTHHAGGRTKASRGLILGGRDGGRLRRQTKENDKASRNKGKESKENGQNIKNKGKESKENRQSKTMLF